MQENKWVSIIYWSSIKRYSNELIDWMMEENQNLRSLLVMSVPQAGCEPFVAHGLALWMSEILVQAVCPLAHRTNVKPKRICLNERVTLLQNRTFQSNAALTCKLLQYSICFTLLLRGAADGKRMPLVLGDDWDVYIHIISRFEVKEWRSFDNQMCYL